MKNFPIIDKETEREYWISRSVAVVILVKAKSNTGGVFILATKRGKGTPDPEFVGSWCLPCGYVEFDETTQEAAARELFEETGLDILPSKFKLVSINDNPKEDKRQNITFRYFVDLSDYSLEKLNEQITSIYNEKDETSDIRFIPIWQVSGYKWAFNHEALCHEILDVHEKQQLIDKINQCETLEDIEGWKTTFQYHSILSKDYDYDYYFLLDLIEFKLKRMSNYFLTNDLVENEHWYGILCNRAISILNAGYKTNIIESKDLNEIYVNTNNINRFLPKCYLKLINSSDYFWEKYGLALVREYKAKKLFWKFLYHYIEMLWE